MALLFFATSLQTEDPSEIRTSFVARLLRYGPDTLYKKCIVFDGGHDWRGSTKRRHLPPEIVPKIVDFSPLASESHRATTRNGRSAITLLWQCRSLVAGAFVLERQIRPVLAATSPILLKRGCAAGMKILFTDGKRKPTTRSTLVRLAGCWALH